MADKNQLGLSQQIKMLSNKFTSSSIILNDSITKTFVSYVSQNMRKASIDHQLLLIKSNRKRCFYTLFKTDITKSDSLGAIKDPRVVHNFSSSWPKFLSRRIVIIERRRRSLLGGSGGMPPRKFLHFKSPETEFP